MKILQFKLEPRWFGLRKQLMIQVQNYPQCDGESEPYWVEGNLETLQWLANHNGQLHSEMQRLRMQLTKANQGKDNDRRTPQMTQAEMIVLFDEALRKRMQNIQPGPVNVTVTVNGDEPLGEAGQRIADQIRERVGTLHSPLNGDQRPPHRNPQTRHSDPE